MAACADPNLPPSESDSWSEDEPYKPPEPPKKKKKVPRKKAKEGEKDTDPSGVKGPDPTYDKSQHQFPIELLTLDEEVGFDEDDLEEDHTGNWRELDTKALVAALNHFRKDLKGNFTGPGGGLIKRRRAWERVAEHINSRTGTRWTDAQVRGKAKRYAKDVKDKYQALRRELNKTGGGTITEDMYLTPLEQSMLDYVGVEGVVGIPGCSGVPLVPGAQMSSMNHLQDNARRAWDFRRDNIPDYAADLPVGRIRAPNMSLNKGKSPAKGKGRGKAKK